MPPITPRDKNVNAIPELTGNKPPPPQREKPPSAGILTNTVHRLQAPEKSPQASPRLVPGAAPLAPAFAFQAPAIPFQTNGAVHGTIADTAPPKPITVAQATTPQFRPAPQTPAATTDALSDADKREIDRWLSDHDPPSAEEIVGKLRSLSKTPKRQQYLIDRAFNLDKQASRNLIPFSRVGDLVNWVQRDAPMLQGVIAERLMNCAINSQRRLEGDGTLDDPHNQARACALHALDIMRGNDRELGLLVSSLEDGALFGQALGNGNRLDSGLMSEARNRVLAALNGVPHTETTSAVVGTLCSQTVPIDIWRKQRLADNIATALAREWHLDDAGKVSAEQHRLAELAETGRLKDLMESRQGVQLMFGGSPDRNLTTLLTIQYNSPITAQALAGDAGEWVKNPVVAEAMADRLVPSDAPDRAATVKRLAGILAIDNGQELLFGQFGFADSVLVAARAEALQAMLADSSITARTLTETDPWTNPQLVEGIARARAAKSEIRNDEPTQLNGYNKLSNFVGHAMGMGPTGENELDIALAVITGSRSVYPQENVATVVDKIRSVGGLNPKITFVPVNFSNRDIGVVQFALFRVETGVQKIRADGSSVTEAVYVDHLGRVYKTIGDGIAAPGTKQAEPSGWLVENKLPEGVVVYFKNGHVNTDPSGALIFAHADTPRHPVKKALNMAALVGGIVAGGLIIVGTGGTATVLLGVGCSLWGLNSAREELADRADHGQSNSLRNAEARALWFSLAANATGVAAFAAGAVLRPLLSQAGMVGKVSALTVGGANWAATVTNAGTFVNGSIDLVTNPPKDPLMAVLNLAFQATVSVVGARHAGSLGEVFNPVANMRRITEAYRPPVQRTSALPGNRVQIENVNGRRVIFASPTAPQELIDLHVEIARMMALDQGIIGLLARGLFGGAKPGTLAYAANYELIKLGKLTELLNARLNEPQLTPQQRQLLQRDIAIVRAYGDKVTACLADHAGAGEVPVASPDTASARDLEALGDNARDALKKLAGHAGAAEQTAAVKAIREYYEALKKVSGPEAALDRVSLQMMIDAYELMPGRDAALVAEVKKYLNGLVGKENIPDLFKPVAPRGLQPTGSPAQVPAKIDLDRFWPNPKAPNGPVLLKHDDWAKRVAAAVEAPVTLIGKLLRRTPSYDRANTYKALYDKASPELRKFLPAPGTFKADDNTVALGKFIGGLERLIADIHAHPYGYDHRSPWNDWVLGIRRGTDALVGLLKATGQNATVAIEAIAQGCGSPGGYYADANAGPLSMKQAAELDRRVAEVYLAVYGQGPAGQALAAKGHLSMTGLDFSEKPGVLARYRATAKAYHDEMSHLADLNQRWDAAETTFQRAGEFDAAAAEMTRQQRLGAVTRKTLEQYEAAGKALEDALSKRVKAPPGLYDRNPASAAKFNALRDETLKALQELRADEAEARAQSADPVVHTQALWKRFPGVFTLFGEITANKELVGQALGAGKWDVSDPKFKRWLDFLVAHNIRAPIVLHSDWGHAGLNEAGRPAAVQMAYENLPEIVRVFGDARYRDLNVIFAHTGIGRYVRPNAVLVEVSVIDRSTGQRVTRHVPEHIAMLYQVAEKVPNAKFDISWNDVTQAYVDNPSLQKALVDFIIDNQDRILFGSDTVKPVNTGHYNQALNTGAPLFAEVARRDPEALWKLLRGNSEKLLNDGAASVADWTHKNLSDPKALAAMDERNKILADHRARMLSGARADFDIWVAQLKAQGSPGPSSNPGFFPAFFLSHPDAHDHDDHPLEGANPKYGPVGRGTPGGYVNEPPNANPIAAQAVRNNNIAAASVTTGAVAVGAVAMEHMGDHADPLAFLGRGAALAVRALYTEKLRLDWEQIFEEGHVTRNNLNTFVSGIFDAAGPLKISAEQKVLIAAATEQFFANYETLAAQPLDSYESIDGTIEGRKAQRFNAIMAKVGEYQIAVDRILGMQASSINPLDARTTLGKIYRTIILGTYLVNDVAAAEWLGHGKLDLSTPAGKAEAAFHILFALGNAGKTAEAIAGLSGGLSGRLNESSPLFKSVLQKYSNWALTLGGAAWTASDAMTAYNKILAGGALTGQAGVDSVKVMLDLAFTYGIYRITGFEAAKAGAAPLPHVRNLAWATAVVGGALVLREIIRELEEREKKKSANVAPAAAPATPAPPAMPGAAPAATVH